MSDVGEREKMRSMFIILFGTLVLMTGCRKEELTQIKVWDQDFQVINTITNSTDLISISTLWQDRTTTTEKPNFTHKVDVATSENSVRWLYDPSGYAAVLNKKKMPIYKLNDSDKLKKILIPNSTMLSAELPFRLAPLPAIPVSLPSGLRE